MPELKTKENTASVTAFIDSVEDEIRRKDCRTMLALMKKVTKKKPRMWGENLVGFGKYHYKYASGREGDWFVTGFSPRKQNFTVYIMPGFSEYSDLLAKLGKHKTGKSCLYIKNLADIELKVLEKLVKLSIEQLCKIYKCS